MTACKTSVRTGLESPMFRPCGEPALYPVTVGAQRCHYCAQHAAEARRWVESQGQASIAATQAAMRVTSND